MIENLTEGERFFLNVHRYFEFLRLEGYTGNEFDLSLRDCYYVSFYNFIRKIKITIVDDDDGCLKYYIEKKTLFGWSKLYNNTGINIKNRSLTHIRKVIKSNNEIMNVLLG